VESLDSILKSGSATAQQALYLYDRLDPVDTEFMIGRWKGSEFRTGHKMDGLLDLAGWYGKLFIDPETVHPLLFYTSDPSTVYAVNPNLIPMTLNYPKIKYLRNIMKWAKLFLKTEKSKARLRMMEYRGKLSAAMIYDGKSINDHFRRIDDHKVMGLMDMKGEVQPYFFILERDDHRELQVQLPL